MALWQSWFALSLKRRKRSKGTNAPCLQTDASAMWLLSIPHSPAMWQKASIWPFPTAVISSLGGAVGEGTSISFSRQNLPGWMRITSAGTAEETGAPWPDGARDPHVVLLASKSREKCLRPKEPMWAYTNLSLFSSLLGMLPSC